MKINEWFENRKRDKYLNELYDEKYRLFFSVAMNILNNTNDVEDAISDAFIKIAANIDRIFSIPCHKRVAYCVKIVKTSSYNIIRNRQKIVSTDNIIEIIDSKFADDDIVENIFNEITKEKIVLLLEELGDLELQLIRLRYYEDLSFRDIGERLCISEALSRKRHERIIKKLRKIIEDKGLDYD